VGPGSGDCGRGTRRVPRDLKSRWRRCSASGNRGGGGKEGGGEGMTSRVRWSVRERRGMERVALDGPRWVAAAVGLAGGRKGRRWLGWARRRKGKGLGQIWPAVF
jgi:hypothetical protein